MCYVKMLVKGGQRQFVPVGVDERKGVGMENICDGVMMVIITEDANGVEVLANGIEVGPLTMGEKDGKGYVVVAMGAKKWLEVMNAMDEVWWEVVERKTQGKIDDGKVQERGEIV
jgi:hypothetical protein